MLLILIITWKSLAHFIEWPFYNCRSRFSRVFSTEVIWSEKGCRRRYSLGCLYNTVNVDDDEALKLIETLNKLSFY